MPGWIGAWWRQPRTTDSLQRPCPGNKLTWALLPDVEQLSQHSVQIHKAGNLVWTQSQLREHQQHLPDPGARTYLCDGPVSCETPTR